MAILPSHHFVMARFLDNWNYIFVLLLWHQLNWENGQTPKSWGGCIVHTQDWEEYIHFFNLIAIAKAVQKCNFNIQKPLPSRNDELAILPLTLTCRNERDVNKCGSANGANIWFLCMGVGGASGCDKWFEFKGGGGQIEAISKWFQFKGKGCKWGKFLSFVAIKFGNSRRGLYIFCHDFISRGKSWHQEFQTPQPWIMALDG
jgi:hypothetical protein